LTRLRYPAVGGTAGKTVGRFCMGVAI